MVVKAWPQVGSGGRKPEVLIKLVVEEGNSKVLLVLINKLGRGALGAPLPDLRTT